MTEYVRVQNWEMLTEDFSHPGGNPEPGLFSLLKILIKQNSRKEGFVEEQKFKIGDRVIYREYRHSTNLPDGGRGVITALSDDTDYIFVRYDDQPSWMGGRATYAEDLVKEVSDIPVLYCENCEKQNTECQCDTGAVNHPTHYNSGNARCDCGRRIECIDVARHMDFNLGNALKYIWRSEYKNGAEDIRKAIWYLNDYLEKLYTKSVDNIGG